jgi:UDP-glucose 4-epimerase
VELLARDFKEVNQGIKVTVVRPLIVYGPNVNNYISRYFTRMSVILTVGRKQPDMQFVY